MASALGQDLGYALRQLRAAPGFSAVAVLTFALGIGGVTALGTVLNAVLWRPLPFDRAEQLALVQAQSHRPGPPPLLSYPTVREIEERVQGLGEVASFTQIGTFNLLWQRAAGQQRVAGVFVSPNFFSVLGVRPLAGRTFTRADAAPAAVLSHRFWRTEFGGDAKVIGTSMSLPGAFTIVGVMPQEFQLDEDVDLWLAYDSQTFATWGPERRAFQVLVRLQGQPGADMLRQRLSGVPGTAFVVTRLRDALVGDVKARLLLLFAAVSAVVVLGCVNIATLMLDRSVARQREVAVRLALGATRARIALQFIVEGGMLAVFGGTLGFMLALQIVHWLVSADLNLIPRLAEVQADTSLLLATILSTAVCGVVAGLVPLRRIGPARLGYVLKGLHATDSKDVRRWRRALAVAQIGVAFSLILVSGLIVRSLVNVLHVDLGFDPDNLLTIQLSSEIEDPIQRLAFYQGLVSDVRALPGVSNVGIATRVPLQEGGAAGIEYVSPGGDLATSDVEVRRASRDYFATMGIRLAGGRSFSQEDRLGTAPVAVVNETAARQLWPGASAIDQRLRFPRTGQQAQWITVIGIVGDVRHFGRESDPRPEVYLCLEQGPPFGPVLVMRTSVELSALATRVQNLVRARDAAGASFGSGSMASILAAQVRPRWFATAVLAGFGALAVVLAFVGVYATVSQVMAGRRREIAIRMTVGATPGEVLRLAIVDAVLYMLPGLPVGAGIAIGVSGVLGRFLFGITGFDPVTVVLVSLGVSMVVVLAALAPALRAAWLDPAAVLRAE